MQGQEQLKQDKKRQRSTNATERLCNCLIRKLWNKVSHETSTTMHLPGQVKIDMNVKWKGSYRIQS